MAQIIEETITVRLSRIARDDADGGSSTVTPDVVQLIDATLQEVLELPAGTVVEVVSSEG